MKFRKTNSIDKQHFKHLCQQDRLEEMTCRPVENGKVVINSNQPETWTFSTDDQEIIGWFNLFDFNERNRSSEFGYGIIPTYRRRGYAKLMLSSAFTKFFSERNLHKLYCQTASFNVASVKLLESLGLVRDGILRDHHELDGKLYDDYIYSLLESEWFKK